jgi:hypothetical protein
VYTCPASNSIRVPDSAIDCVAKQCHVDCVAAAVYLCTDVDGVPRQEAVGVCRHAHADVALVDAAPGADGHVCLQLQGAGGCLDL